MDTSAGEARAELQRGLKLYEAFKAADKVLAVLESADQLLREREQAAAAAVVARNVAEGAAEAARVTAAAVIDDADQYKADAKEAAAKLTKDARAKADKTLRDAEAAVAELKTQLMPLNDELAKKRKELGEILVREAQAIAVIERGDKVAQLLRSR